MKIKTSLGFRATIYKSGKVKIFIPKVLGIYNHSVQAARNEIIELCAANGLFIKEIEFVKISL